MNNARRAAAQAHHPAFRQPYPIATCAHGTAFDKVGKASVTTDSFERAVRTTAQMALAKRTKANG